MDFWSSQDTTEIVKLGDISSKLDLVSNTSFIEFLLSDFHALKIINLRDLACISITQDITSFSTESFEEELEYSKIYKRISISATLISSEEIRLFKSRS